MPAHPVFFARLRSACVDGETGASLVEMALSVSILLTVVFGIIFLSLALYSYFYISNAAREATRYAIVRGSDQPGDCTSPGYANCRAQSADIQSYVQGLGFPGINSNNLTVTTNWLTSSGAACSPTDNCNSPGDLVQSKVTYTYPLTIPGVKQSTLTMSSTSQMVISY
jgi:Flp pilus assembly protein TadG